jgi:hypothetical protein
MPRIAYVKRRFQSATMSIIQEANSILQEYHDEGFTLTLRACYYRFIAEDLFPDSWVDDRYNKSNGLQPGTKNTNKSYKRLSSILSEARLAGLIDWDFVEDRVRQLAERPKWNSPESFMDSVIPQYHIELWNGQKFYCEVWGEKDSVSDILAKACDPLDVPYFICRGSTSQSEMWAASQRLGNLLSSGFKVVILHLGDHDPSGVDMTRDIQDRLALFCEHDVGEVPLVNRIALTMNQVDELNPPPNPVKASDANAAKYVQKYGHECWELDALRPQYMVKLITDWVTNYLDVPAFEKRLKKEDGERKALEKAEKARRKEKK